MLKAILFAFLFYVLVKVISRLFLQPKKKNGNFRFFYQTFKNVRNQQKKQQEQQNQAKKGGSKDDLDNIEEADFEDITEDERDTSQ